MRPVLLALLGVGVLAGCSQPEEAVPPQVSLNPSGKPRNAQEAQVAQGMQQAGNNANAAMEDAARKMREAQARTGGK